MPARKHLFYRALKLIERGKLRESRQSREKFRVLQAPSVHQTKASILPKFSNRKKGSDGFPQTPAAFEIQILKFLSISFRQS